MRAVLLAMTIFPVSGIASADNFYDGNRLHEHCLGNNTYAHLYVIGVVDGMDTLSGVLDLKPPYCLPENVTARQVSDVACNFLRDNPERRQYTAASLVMGAMMKAFPCQK